ncbi:hypothetical protein [Bacillus sp. JJ722]|uniref:hypothetical protein n=1 Tax=Bacillus sp. JJ722 TaxID=3122973 RepID=UPI002FFF496D
MHILPYINYTPYNPYIPAYYMIPQPLCYPANIRHRVITYPPVDPTIFMKSANKIQELLEDAHKLSAQVSKSHAFSKQIIEAAQESKTDKIKQLLSTLALKNRSDIYYNPDGIIITLKPKDPHNNCCTVSVSLKWQNL